MTQFQKRYKTMSSPFFPALYPHDFIKEHLIICDTELKSTIRNITAVHSNTIPFSNICRIRVIFTDFQLTLVTTMEVHICLVNYQLFGLRGYTIFYVEDLRLEWTTN